MNRAAAADALPVLIYAQHLSGVGHFVRMHELGRALAARHAVWMTDGGREVVRRSHGDLRLLALPRIERRGAGLAALEAGASPEQALQRRREALAEAVGQLRPAVLVIEHFPFSKWELRAEIEALIAAARSARPSFKYCLSRELL